jgi:hypothetical protein
MSATTASVWARSTASTFASIAVSSGDQFGGQLPAGPPDDVTGSHGGQQGAGLRRGQVLLGAAGHELQQLLVQPVDRVGAGAAQDVAAIDKQPQCDRGVINRDLPQPLGPQRGHRDAVRVDRIGFAALAGGEHPRPRR